MKLSVVLYPGEDGYIVAKCPVLPGCISQGKTREEALANIKEAIIGCIEVRIEVGKEIGYRRDIGIPSKRWECLPRSKAAGAASCAHAQALGPV